MEKLNIIAALSALAHETRLNIFRYLVQIGPAGVPAGQIGEHFALPLATLSFHLKTLQQAGLLGGKRQSRSIIYSANFTTINAVIGYLLENCCGGRPESCGVSLCEPGNAGGAAPEATAKKKTINAR